MTVDSQRRAVAALAVEHDAHVVLADANKRPCWLESGPYSWRRRRATPELIAEHRGRFGIVPWSIRTTGLDVDDGDPQELALAASPLVTLPTRRGHHLYFPDTSPRGNATFATHGCRGDVRGARGYLVLHGDGAERLLDAIMRRDDWHPRDLFDLVGLPSITAPAERRRGLKVVASSPLRGLTLTLAEARPGYRRNVLHRYLIDEANRTNRPRRWPGGPVDLAAWNAAILEIAIEALRQMPHPRLQTKEVKRLAYCVSTWAASTWKADHSPETQRWRSARAAEVRVKAAAQRHAAIREEAARGASVGELMAAFGVSRITIWRAMSGKRDVFHHPVRVVVPFDRSEREFARGSAAHRLHRHPPPRYRPKPARMIDAVRQK